MEHLQGSRSSLPEKCILDVLLRSTKHSDTSAEGSFNVLSSYLQSVKDLPPVLAMISDDAVDVAPIPRDLCTVLVLYSAKLYVFVSALRLRDICTINLTLS